MSVAAKKWTPPAGARQLFPVGALNAVKKWPTIQPEVPDEVTNRVIKKENIAKLAIAEGGSYDLLAKLGIAKPMPRTQPQHVTPPPVETTYDELKDRPKEQRPSGFNLLATVGTAERTVLTKRVSPVVSSAYKSPVPSPRTETPTQAPAATVPAWKQKILERKSSIPAAVIIPTPASTPASQPTQTNLRSVPAIETKAAPAPTPITSPLPAPIVAPKATPAAVVTTTAPATVVATPAPVSVAPAQVSVASTPAPVAVPTPVVEPVAAPALASTATSTPQISASTPVASSAVTSTATSTPQTPTPTLVATSTFTTTVTTVKASPVTTPTVAATTPTFIQVAAQSVKTPSPTSASSRASVISRWQPNNEVGSKPLIKINTTVSPRAASVAPSAAVVVKVETVASPTTDGPKQLYPLEELLKKPAGVNLAYLEHHLIPEDYPKAFKVTIDEFKKMPVWKQKQLKMTAKLF